MNARDKRIDVSIHTDEYMCEQKHAAEQQGLSVSYDRFNNKVWISDRRDGEGGMFNMFDFLCADDPRKFFAENF